MIGKNKVSKLLIALVPVLIISSACSSSKMEKRIQEVEKENEQVQKEVKSDEDTLPEDVELSEESLDTLEGLEKVTPEEALAEHELELREEMKIVPVEEKSVYKDEKEFSQYIGYLYFMYHSNEITAEEFYEKVSPHFHEEFKLTLPAELDQQVDTFKILQETFQKYLAAPVISYKLTNVALEIREREANFYRLYELKNGERVYYETIIKKEDEQWLLLHDKPAPPYEITPNIENELN